MSVNCTLIGTDPKLLFIAKKDIGERAGPGGIVGFMVTVGDGVKVGKTGFSLTHTKKENESFPPLPKTVSVGAYFPSAV